MRQGSLSFKDVTEQVHLAMVQKLEQSALSELVRNTLALLIKHNLVKAWQSEYDQITYYTFDQEECLLRLSMPRYLVRVGTLLS